MFGRGVQDSVRIGAGISVACLGVLGLPPLRGDGGEDPKVSG